MKSDASSRISKLVLQYVITVQCPSTSVFGTYHTVSDMIVIAVVNVFAKIKTRPRH